MHFNIIGAGRLGKALALALVNSGAAQLAAVCNKNFTSAVLAVEQIGSGLAVPLLADLPAVDLTFITSPDDAIPYLAHQLAQDKIIAPQTIVVHCSGVLSSTALNLLKDLGCHIASIHPLKAFRAGNLDMHAFKGCDCVIEGDESALIVLSSLFKQLEARVIPIQAEGKIAYHAAAVIASNYLVTLAATSIHLFEEAGIPANLAQQMTTRLMQSSLHNIQQTSNIADALTGPLLRGDINTISSHLKALPNPAINTLYRSAALATLPMTGLNMELQLKLRSLLTEAGADKE